MSLKEYIRGIRILCLSLSRLIATYEGYICRGLYENTPFEEKYIDATIKFYRIFDEVDTYRKTFSDRRIGNSMEYDIDIEEIAIKYSEFSKEIRKNVI